MVAIDRPPPTGVLLDIGGTLCSERWKPDPPLLAARMHSALPDASSTQLEMVREEFTRLAASSDWRVEQDVHQLITSAANLAGPRLPPDDAHAVRQAMRVLSAERCVCRRLAALIVFRTLDFLHSGWVYAAWS
jgi:hypothetical protein